MAGWTCAGCTTVYAVGAAKCPHCGSTERTSRAGGAVLPSVTVACGTSACQYEGRERRVHLRTAAPGVLEMPRLVCAGCGFDMPTVTPWPPVTDSEDEQMPKITVHGGPSIAGASVVDEPDVGLAPEPEEGGEVVESSVEQDSAVGPDYEAWTVEELKEQLAERGLPKSGKRDELVQRLRDDDAAEAE